MVALARQQSERLEPSLIQLSELLRYMLYESQQERIALSAEIGHITNYVALQKLRFEDNVSVTMEISDAGEEQLIEPMLLIPFIENAFKHGIGLQQDAYIHIALSLAQGLLEFSVVNNYVKDDSAKDKNPGIGLVNVKNRLELLYPGKYELHLSDKENVFSVHLKLQLV
jgi:two-component system, LytTR family, sensor kinase